MATAPRYSYGPDPETGASAYYYPVLLLAALVLGFVAPTHARLVGILLGLPGLILSPWTTPRGDNDGLWALVVPLLCVFVLVLTAAARFGAWALNRFAHSDRV